MNLKEMITANYSLVAVSPNGDSAKDRDITGDVESLLTVVETAQKLYHGEQDKCVDNIAALYNMVEIYEWGGRNNEVHLLKQSGK